MFNKKQFFFFILLFSSTLHAQETLRGFIRDSANSPLIEALVFNSSTQQHTHTDANGFFELKNISIGNILEINYLGYRNKTVVVENLRDLSIVLEKTALDLSEVIITASTRTFKQVAAIDLRTQPVNSSQELLRKVPGLFIGQHAGGGKAEQIFLRGFDIDHGTDVAIDVDGLPVNMVSHAHGQGYADLHFVIPETVEKIDFDKGTYYADKGNLATAGYVSFKTKEILNQNMVGLELGQFNSRRALSMFNLANNEHHKAYVAAELLQTDGAFDSPQNFNRFNILGKYTQQYSPNDKFSFSFSHFKSRWDASGQIPERAVNQGLISRFGAIDDTEGGYTSRTNIALQYQKNVSHNTTFKSRLYYSHYDFELFSNFTFFLNDSINGDQIKQKENRNIIGIETTLEQHFHKKNMLIWLQGGIGLRNDAINDNELSHTKNRTEIIERIAFGDINETNTYAFFNTEIEIGRWLVSPAIRADFFDFNYQNKLDINYKTASVQKAFLSPKINFSYQIDKKSTIYAKFGRGFHSNDTRVVIAQNGKKILPQALGTDIGINSKLAPKLLLNAALWYLHLDQEFVYVGDEGVVEPGGKTARKGIDLGLRYQLGKSLFFNSDLTYTIARSTEAAEGENYIPLAPRFTLVSGMSWLSPKGISAGLNARYLGNRPANEDNSIVAKSYFVCDANINYSWKNSIELGLNVQNIFNAEWNETQFATESRLKNEAQSVEEIHFTPGTPFFAKAILKYKF